MSETAIATRNPFATERAVEANRNQNAIGDVAVQREIAEVQAAVIMARRFPRDPISAMDRLLQHCTRRTLAEQALYSYSRGGTEITGPSIRLAEAAAQSWGNVQFGIRELEQRKATPEAAGESTVEALCWDLETNTRETKVFQVPHIRYTRSGTTRLTDPRDIYETIANQGARRLRSCILGIIPGDVIDAAVQQCEETLKASADTSPEALKRVAEAFAEFGVTREQIEQRCQCRLEAIRPAQLVQLRKVYTSLKDGMSAAADWFRPVEGQAAPQADAQERREPTGNAALRERLGSRQPDPREAKAQLARRPAEQSEGERFLTNLQIDLDAAHTFNAIDKLGLREDVAPVTGQLRERVLAAFAAARKRVASENAAAAPIENDPQNAPVDALAALKQEIDKAQFERLRDRASSAEWKAELRALPSDADRASAERYAEGRLQTLRAGA